jgi:hypothetical protein
MAQLWDKDLISSNDMIGEATLKLDRWFRRVYKRKQKLPNYWDAEGDERVKLYEPGSGMFASLSEALESFSADSPLLGGPEEDPALDSSKWFIPLNDFNRTFVPLDEDPSKMDRSKMTKDDIAFFENPPRIVMSLQLVPKELLEKFPAGDGRSEPNKNPVLPKPVGRLKFTLNPFSLLYQLVGPEVYYKICGLLCKVLCCVICILLAYYTIPVVFGNIVSQPFTS